MVEINMHFESKNALTKNKRIASRCVLLRNDKILMSYEKNTDQWMIPGGGLEDGETIQNCCVREVAEETGIVIEPKEQFLTINEYFDDLIYVNHYFTAEYVGDSEIKLTDSEIINGLVPQWIPLNDAIKILSKYNDYAQTDPMKCGLYRREHTTLSYFNTAIFNKY